MKKLSSTLLLCVAWLLLAAVPGFAQFHPYPGSAASAPVRCTPCPGYNPYQELNEGLPTFPFSGAIKRHVGRFVDSTDTTDNQGAGMRTARAGKIRVAPARAGLPARLYVQVGAAMTAYSIDSFVNQKLPAGMKDVDVFYTGIQYSRFGRPFEKVAPPDGFLYPESPSSGWTFRLVDGQERLMDFDYDDRGYVYAAYMIMGWGIVKDSGETSGSMFPKVAQVLETEETPASQKSNITPEIIFTLKVGNTYYAIVSNDKTPSGAAVYDVTNPASPSLQRVRPDSANSVVSWAKDPSGDKLAIVNGAKQLQIFNASSYVVGSSAAQTFTATPGKTFIGVSADRDGNFWAIEQAQNLAPTVLWRISPSGGSYVAQSFNVYGEAFNPYLIQANDNYVMVAGYEAGNQFSQAPATRVFKIEGGEPKMVDTGKFFRNFYHFPPQGYAKPAGYTNVVRGLGAVKDGNKVYFVYAAHGLGDVFELQAGDAITASQTPGFFGTPNPNSKGTESGPFYGDVLSFNAASSNPNLAFNVQWDFGNPEYPANNTASSRTGTAVTHQYGGLSTAAQITAPKRVKVNVATDASVADGVNVSLKVPQPRLYVVGSTDAPLTAGGRTLDLVYGEQFADGSDGSVESHFTTWTIDGVATSLMPNAAIGSGAVGAHTLTMTTVYGPYTAGATPSTLSSPTYTPQIANITYNVRPYVIVFNPMTAAGNNVTFSASARRTTDTSVLSATQWTVTWTLRNASGTAIVAPTPSTGPIGVIPAFTLDRSTIPNNSTVTLSITVPEAGLSPAAKPFATMAISNVLSTPDPVVSIQTGCGNAGSPCTLKVASQSGAATTDWQYSWSVAAPNGTVVATGTGSTISPTLTAAGTYSVALTVTKSVFSATAPAFTFTVAAPTCGPGPGPNNIAINSYGTESGCRGTNCKVGENFEFGVSPWGYTVQDCDVFSWNFGDNTTASGRNTSHSYGAGATGPYTVTLTISNSSGSSQTYTKTISFNGGTTPNQPTCTAPTSPSITYSGSQGCGPTVSCKVNETINFFVTRSGGINQQCDGATWTFGDGNGATGLIASKSYSTTGTYTVTATMQNSAGSAPAVSTTLTIVPGGTSGGCPAPRNAQITWTGQSSGCTPLSTGVVCRRNEQIKFEARMFNQGFSGCELFEWTFGDGQTSSERDPLHQFVGQGSNFRVRLRIYNATGDESAVERTITLEGGQQFAVPTLTIVAGPTSAGRNSTVTFTAASNIATTTGWTWDFSDGTIDSSQAGLVGGSSTVTHKFANAGTYVVRVTARNSQDSQSAPTGAATRQVDVVSTPTYRFLLPAVAHLGGADNSVWRTDVQVFNSDLNVSSTNPLVLNVEFKGRTQQVNVTQSTFIAEDFMRRFTDGDEQGPMIVEVTTDHVPQIWTRTYNQTAAGTFGQFIPAVLLSGGATTSSATIPTTPSNYYLPGIRSGSRYRTNLGFVNPLASTLNVTGVAYDDQGNRLGQFTQTLPPFQLVQVNVAAVLTGIPADKPFNIRIGELAAGQWLIAYASQIDRFSNDPTYIGAINDVELSSTDYNDIVVPGVGHVNAWRSDVTIFNPDSESVTVDLAYFNQTGQKVAESTNVTIRSRNFLQLDDLLRAGYLTPQPADGLGMLRIRTRSSWTQKYPLAYSRTYFDKQQDGSFGQGIGAFSISRANVKANKPAIIPAVRSDNNYYTNIGLVNLTDQTAKVRVTLLRADNGADAGSFTFDLAPNQSIVRSPVDGKDLLKAIDANATRGTFRVEIVEGSAVWAFASVIDRQTNDPEYVAAVPMN